MNTGHKLNVHNIFRRRHGRSLRGTETVVRNFPKIFLKIPQNILNILKIPQRFLQNSQKQPKLAKKRKKTP